MEDKKESPFKGKKFVLVEREGPQDAYARWGFLDGYLNYQLDALATEIKALMERGEDYARLAYVRYGIMAAAVAIEVIDEMWDRDENEIYAEIERRLRKGEEGEA